MTRSSSSSSRTSRSFLPNENHHSQLHASAASSTIHPNSSNNNNNYTSGVIGRRCASYLPTLYELKHSTFEEYIRGEVLGVPLPGYEFVYVYEEKNDGRELKRVLPMGQQKNKEIMDPKITTTAATTATATTATATTDPSSSSTTTTTTTSSSEMGVVLPNDEEEKKEKSKQPMSTTKKDGLVVVPTTTTTTMVTPTTTTTTMTTTHSSMVATETTGITTTPTTTITTTTSGMVLRSRSQPSVPNNNHHAKKKKKTTTTTTTTTKKKEEEYSPPKYQMCWYKLRDGIAKVTLPVGFHTKMDTTARGRHWAKGSKLGDMIIPSPIQQAISGIGGVYEYTLLEQPSVTVSQFRTMADEYRRRQLGNNNNNNSSSSSSSSSSKKKKNKEEMEKDVDCKNDVNEEEKEEDYSDEACDELARKFWKRLGPTMEPPIYGADMEGTLFPKDAYACGWNVNRLESCLCLLRADGETMGSSSSSSTATSCDNHHLLSPRMGSSTTTTSEEDPPFHLPGVTSAYLYFGMWASAFAAHTEDMNLLSINYLHAGAPKYWYGIAQEDSKRYESLAQSHFPVLASECSEFLRHKRCMLSPTILRKAGIKFTTCVQRPGDAVITFPGCYHFGFNTGFNVAESTNFAVPEWIPLGMQADICMCHPHSVRIQMDRVKSLLDSYEKDMHHRELNGLTRLTYTNWAKQEAKRLKKKQRDSLANDKHQDLTMKGMNGVVHSSSSMTKISNTSLAVEITNETYTTLVSKKSKKKRKLISTNEWRLAKHVRPSVLVPSVSVICMVECQEKDDNDDSLSSSSAQHEDGNDFEWFIGTIVKVVDGYVKVHFVGLTKKDDLWYEQSSDRLFLDGGVIDPPSSVVKKEKNVGKQKKNH